MFHALTDQLSYQPGLSVNSHSQLRQMLVKAAYNSIKSGKLLWGCDGSLEDWRVAMRQEGTMGDEIILQAASNLFQISSSYLCSVMLHTIRNWGLP